MIKGGIQVAPQVVWRFRGTEVRPCRGDCQLRKGEGQTRHMYLVIPAHSLLVSQMRTRLRA